MSKDDNYTNVLLEEMNSKMQAVLEIVSDNQRVLANQPTRDEFKELKAEVATVKAAVTDTNKELKLHDRRITKLEKVVTS